MPKISTNRIKVYHKNIDQIFDIHISYNKDFRFYASIPEAFDTAFEAESEKSLEKFGALRSYRSKLREQGPYNRIVSASTESGLLQQMEDLIKHLMDTAIVTTPVILVYYENKGSDEHKRHKNDFPELGFEFGLTYAIETKVGNHKPKYYTHYKRDWFGKMEEVKEQVTWWKDDVKIIPDTPENREALEKLYNALVALRKELKKYTNSPENILKLINSNVKLLN